MTDLAKLVVRLEAQTAEYMRQLDAANKRLDKFGRTSAISAKSIATGLVAAAGAAATAFAAMAKHSIDVADQTSKLSQTVGIATEDLSQLQYAAGLSGTATEDLTKGLVRLSKNMADAADGLATPREAFDKIGVSVKNADGSLRDSQEVLLDVADKFSTMADGAAKAAVAQDLFGKAGAKMIPFLDAGRAGIQAMKDEADAFGLTLGGEAAAQAEEFNDNLTRLKAASSGVVNQFVQEALPTLVALTERFLDATKNSDGLKSAIGVLAVTFKSLVTAGVVVKSVFQTLGRVIYGVGAAIVRVAQGEFKLALGEITDAFVESKDDVSGSMDTIAAIWSDKVETVAKISRKLDNTLKENILFDDDAAGKAAASAVQKALDELKKLADGLQDQVATFGMGEQAVIRYRLAHGDLAEAVKEAGAQGAVYAEAIIAQTDALEQLKVEQEAVAAAEEKRNALLDEGASLTESLMTPSEEYARTLEHLLDLLNANAIGADTYSRALVKATEEFNQANAQAEKNADESTNTFLKQANDNVQSILGDGLASVMTDGVKEGAKGVLAAFQQMLNQMVAQALAARIGKFLFGGEGMGSGGGFLGSVFSTLSSRDSGGRGRRGSPVMIGTGAQPEVFVPDSPGTFYPAGAYPGMGGGGVTQVFKYERPPTERTVRQQQRDATRGLQLAARLS